MRHRHERPRGIGRALIICALLVLWLHTSSAFALRTVREDGEVVYLWPTRAIPIFDGSHAHAREVRRAIALWNAAQVGRRFTLVTRNRARVVVTDVGSLPDGADGEGTEGFVPNGQATIQILASISSGAYATEVVAHELGHVLGLEHTHGVCSLMNPDGNELCPTLGHKPWLRFCRVIQPVDVHAATRLYRGRGFIGAAYCSQQPPWDGSIDVDETSHLVEILGDDYMTGVVARFGHLCNEGATMTGGASWTLTLPSSPGCLTVYGLYPEGHTSASIEVAIGGSTTPGPLPQQPINGESVPPPIEEHQEPPAPPLEWNFDTQGVGPWVSSQPGRWQLTSEAAGGNGGTYSVSDSPYGDYPNNQTAYFTDTQPFSLTGQSNCQVAPALRYELEYGDYFQVEMSTDDVTWAPVSSPLSGSSEGLFLEPIYSLVGYDGLPTVWIRVSLHADASGNADGVYLYDIGVYCVEG
jgi:hypothetical protein